MAGDVVKEGNFVIFGALIHDVLVQLFQLFVVDVDRDGLIVIQQVPVQNAFPVPSDLRLKTTYPSLDAALFSAPISQLLHIQPLSLLCMVETDTPLIIPSSKIIQPV